MAKKIKVEPAPGNNGVRLTIGDIYHDIPRLPAVALVNQIKEILNIK